MEENNPEINDYGKRIMLAQLGIIVVVLGFLANMFWSFLFFMPWEFPCPDRFSLIFLSVTPEGLFWKASFLLACGLPALGMAMCRHLPKNAVRGWRWLVFISIVAWIIYMVSLVFAQGPRPPILVQVLVVVGIGGGLLASHVAWQIFLLRLAWWTRSWITLALGVCVLGMFLFVSLGWCLSFFLPMWRHGLLLMSHTVQLRIALAYIGMYGAFLVGVWRGLGK